jgi:dienelactone hydrolase
MQYETRSVHIPAERVTLDGDLTIPPDARGLILFAHGSGSSRHSPRNKHVARVLQDADLATLLFDLLTRDEERVDERTLELRFDISFLATRLAHASNWAAKEARVSDFKIGFFGASTGAAAALVAAAERPQYVAAVVSRGGRPDLAGAYLRSVQAPTLLIVGSEDDVVLDLNNQAMAQLRCETTLEIIPGATHLFEEPGALDEVARLARDWFIRHFHRRQDGSQAA